MRRRTVLGLTLLLIAFLVPHASAGRPESPAEKEAAPFRLVRPIDWPSDMYLTHGREQSMTLRALVDILETSDVLVYVQTLTMASSRPSAATSFVAHTGLHRVLRIDLMVGSDRSRAISMLGHELQHAVDVARAPHAVDVATYGRLFRDIGFRSACFTRATVCFETATAERAGRHVFRDMVSPARRPALTLAETAGRTVPSRP